MTAALRLLLVEDSPTDAKLVISELKRAGRDVDFERVETADAMRAALERGAWDIVISDWSMPRFSALAALAVLKQSNLDLPFIIVSGTIGEDTAVDAMRAGARDYVLKDKLARLTPAVEREVREYQIHRALREAEKACREAERRSQRIVDSATVGMWMVDARGETTFMNAQMARIFGMDVDEAIRVPVADFLPEEDRAVFVERQTQRRAGRAGAYEQTVRAKDGSLRRLAMEASPLYDSNGAFEGAIAIATDVTERRQMEEALRASDARYRRIVQTTNQGVWTIDVEGKTTFANERMCQLLECPLDELMGGSPSEFLDDEGRAILADYMASYQPMQSEARLLGKKGAVRWVIMDAAPLYDAAGKYEGAFAAMMDVTERRNAQEALRVSETRFSYLSNSGILGISLGSTNGTILEANDTFLKMVGYSREELAAGSVQWREITAPEWREVTERSVQELKDRGFATPFEKEYLCRDGRRISVLVGIAMLDEAMSIAFSVDITAQKNAERALHTSEEQLRQSQKMEAVGRLAGGIAHDFNNVLSVILSYADMLLGDLNPGEPMRGDVEEILTAGKRAADLTRQLLMFSRQQVLDPKVIDLNEVLTSMHKMLVRLVGADVDIASLPAQALGRVRVDPSSIEQVIMNLVVNARDAMPTGGQLTLETGNVVLDEAYAQSHLGVKPGPHVMLAVTDTGTGIEKATLARMFEPFFTTKEKGKGTGLGLSTVFGIVQQSSGSLWVYSELGRGTTFKVYLPCVDSAVEAAGRSMEPPVARRGSETILLVEDDDQVRVVAKGILIRNGYHVIEARNAGEALLHSEEHPAKIDLLLSDVVMPQMSGPLLAKRLASSRPEMKVLCMSGYTDDSIVRHGVLAAQIAFLQKPITPETLTRRVREVLDGA
jgi:two-component system, cell cycle sensor histidine kinase and response regulator CckA